MQFTHLCMGCMNNKGSVEVCPHCQWEESSKAKAPNHLPPRTMLSDQFLVGKVIDEDFYTITYLAFDTKKHQKLAIREFFPSRIVSRSTEDYSISFPSSESQEPFHFGLNKFAEETNLLTNSQPKRGIAKILTLLETNHTAYRIREYVEGTNFERFIKIDRGQISYTLLAKVIQPVISGLEYLHSRGILHYTLQPDNIIVTEKKFGHLINFNRAGFALAHRQRFLEELQEDGYTPIELYYYNEPVTVCTDVYSIAATIYRALTGHPPPPALSRIEKDTIKTPSQLGKTLPIEAETALMRALSIRPALRYQSLNEFKQAFLGSALSDIKEKASTAKEAFTEITCSYCGILNEVLITDLQTGNTTCFACDRPLVLEETEEKEEARPEILPEEVEDTETEEPQEEVTEPEEPDDATELEEEPELSLEEASALTEQKVEQITDEVDEAEEIESQEASELLAEAEIPAEEDIAEDEDIEAKDIASSLDELIESQKADEETTEPEVDTTEFEEEISESESEQVASPFSTETAPPAEIEEPPVDPSLTPIECPSCHTRHYLSTQEILNGAQCNNCGHTFFTGEIEQAGIESAKPVISKPARRPIPVWMWIIAAAILLAGGGFVYWHQLSDNPPLVSESKTKQPDQKSEQMLAEQSNRADSQAVEAGLAEAIKTEEEAGNKPNDQEAMTVAERKSPDSQSRKSSTRSTATVKKTQPKLLTAKSGKELHLLIERIADNGTIKLSTGIFNLSRVLTLDKSIRLEGTGSKRTLVISRAQPSVIEILPKLKVTIKDIGFEHQGDQWADVLVATDANLSVENCAFKGAVFDPSQSNGGNGILLDGKVSGSIRNSHFQGNKVGLHVSQTSVSIIEENDFMNNEVGIKISGMARPRIRKNRIWRNAGNGIEVLQKARPEVIRNQLLENEGNGMVFNTEQYSGTVANNEILKNGISGIMLNHQSQPTLQDNLIKANTQKGIEYQDQAQGTAKNNLIENNKLGGIRVSGRAEPSIIENKIQTNDGDGIEIIEKAKPTINKNEINKNNGDGINLILAEPGGYISNNTCKGNQGYGISILRPAKPTFVNNMLTGNYEGQLYDEESPID